MEAKEKKQKINLDLDLLRTATSAMIAYCKVESTKKALIKHRNTIDLMIESRASPPSNDTGA